MFILPFFNSLDRTLRSVRKLARKGNAFLGTSTKPTVAEQLHTPHNRRVLDALRDGSTPTGENPMNRTITSILFAALAALVISTSARAGVVSPDTFNPHHCIVAGDVALCFTEPFKVDAYSNADVADVNYNGLPDDGSPKWLLTTTDPTRRALVVHTGDATQNAGHDGYVAELYFSKEDGARRWKSLTDDQRWSGYKLQVPRDFFSGGVLIVYRTFEYQWLLPLRGGR